RSKTRRARQDRYLQPSLAALVRIEDLARFLILAQPGLRWNKRAAGSRSICQVHISIRARKPIFELQQDYMRTTLYQALGAISLTTLAASPAYAQAQRRRADAGTCYSISDGDARTYCLARAHADPGRCYSIQASGMRSICLSEVRR